MKHQHGRQPNRRQLIQAGTAGLAGVAAAQLIHGDGVNAQAPTQPTAESTSFNRRFTNKVVLITGATSGIGRATAIAFAREGAKVVFCGRRDQLGKAVAQEIQQAGGEALYVQADVLKAGDVEALVRTTVETYGKLDVAFNNAGVLGVAPLHETPEEEWDRVVNTNLKGVWLAMKYEIPVMLQGGGGAIINTSSLHTYATRPNVAAYAASKQGIQGLTQAAALEYAEAGIRVNEIAPGVIDTPMWRSGPGRTPEGQQRSAQGPAMKRVGRPEEIASSVLWLASDESAYATGAVFLVDGGLVAGLR